MKHLWHRAFLTERPSIGLSLFRFAVAFTVGAHVIPSFFHMGDNYLATAFKTKNLWFFPIGILRLVEASPDWVVWAFVVLFYVSLTAFTAAFTNSSSRWAAMTIRSRFERTGLSPTVPIRSRVTTLPSTYRAFAPHLYFRTQR